MRMSAAGQSSLAPLTVRTAPPPRTSAMSGPAPRPRAALGGATGWRGQEIAEGTQPLADVVDHQPGRRRQSSIARHQDADAALRQARLGHLDVHQFASSDFLYEADRFEEPDVEPRLDHLAHELDGVGDDTRRQTR